MNWPALLTAVATHLKITLLGVAIGAVVGLPLAALLVRFRRFGRGVFSVVDAIQTIPTLAMMTIVMLAFGLNDTTVVVSIALYSLFPITRNTYVGLTGIDAGTIRAGRGIGMTPLQIFTGIRFPIALPMILTGIRLALVTALSITTTGVFIGAGGLGMLIWRGIQTRNMGMMLSGAIPASLLAVFCELFIGWMEKRLKHSQ